MLRLIEYMHSNPSFKRKMFESFNSEDLSKIQKNLNDKKNPTLRKISCLFLCCILENQENCESFLKLTDLCPVNSKICINGVPERISKYINYELLNKLQQSQNHEKSLCWYYSLQMAKEQLPYLQYYQINYNDVRKSINEFVDPQESMIGIIYDKKINQKIPNYNIQAKDNKQQRTSVSPVLRNNNNQIQMNVSQEKYQQRYIVSKTFQGDNNSVERKNIYQDYQKNKTIDQQKNINQTKDAYQMELRLRILKNQ